MFAVKCPYCGGSGELRTAKNDCDAVYRKFKCIECRRPFYTVEADAKMSDAEYLENYLENMRRERK